MSAGDILGGAGEGAIKGAAVAGPVGAIVGGVIGAIGGLFKSKAKKKARQAQKVQGMVDDIQNAATRRQQLREAYITRAAAIASGAAETGGLGSSTVQGGAGGILAQYAYNLRYGDVQGANINQINKLTKASQKYADYAGAVNSVGNAAFEVMMRRPQGADSLGKIPKGSISIDRSFGMGTLGTPNA